MSMFRKPGESSSSDDDSSDGREQTSASAEENLLSRINTLESASSAAVGRRSGGGPASARPPVSRTNTNSNVRDLLLHSLLEEKAVAEAAVHLGKEKSDPEVQALAKETYQGLARQISNQIDDTYASDEMRNQRAAAQDGINMITRNHLTGLSAAVNATATAAAAGASQALVPRPGLGLSADGASVPSRTLETFLGLQPPIPLFLQGHPGLHTDRYAREYEEIELVGKGGYGKVYKVKHKLDDSFYAVKRIMVSSTRLQKIQEHGAQEMENLLQEVRSLARLDHGNIVRYHSAWLEFSTENANVPFPSAGAFVGSSRLLEDASAQSFSASDFGRLQTSFTGLSIDNSFDQPYQYSGANIVFETSDTGAGEEDSKNESDYASFKQRASKKKKRRDSQATIATISSSKSRLSAVKDIEEEDEEDIETIPRTHEPVFEESESIMSNSDIPAHLISTRTPGPALTLNVQMSLYDTSLAAFLSADQQSPYHCFHPCISLELLSSILSGVEYLHARGVVHRDLKPANVFLSLSSDRLPPAGSVDLSSCRRCPSRDCLHVTPRIGDFGLVAALGDSCLAVDAKPVGTEFYRPPSGGKISEKLDVFALGVVAFEMLQRFGTKMERVDALTKLRNSEFPEDFAASIGDLGGKVQRMIGGMVATDEERWGCEDVKREIGTIVAGMKI